VRGTEERREPPMRKIRTNDDVQCFLVDRQSWELGLQANRLRNQNGSDAKREGTKRREKEV